MINERGKFVSKISYVAVLLAAIVMLLVGYSHSLKDELRELVRNTLKEVSSQNVLVVQKEIEGDLNALAEIAERIGAFGDIEDEAVSGRIIDTLTEAVYRHSFKRMGFCETDGMALTTDDRVLDISQEDFFIAAMNGENCVSEPQVDPLGGGEIIVFSSPIRHDEEISGIVFATYRVESLREILAVSSFEGEGYTYIVQRDGDKVVDSVNPTSFQNMTNIFRSMREADKRNNAVVKDLELLLDKAETGYVIFYNKIGKYMYVTPLGINDWFLADVVPVDFMESTSNDIVYRTYLVCMLLAVACVLIGIIVYFEERRKKKQMQNLLYVDDLTGGDTHAKFLRDVEQKAKGAYRDAAFVMMDLDDFKLVNELFGYEEGNSVLRYTWSVLKKHCREEECLGRSIADRFVLWLYFENKGEIEHRITEMVNEIQQYAIPQASEYILNPVFGIYYVDKGDEDVEAMQNCAALVHNLAKQERSNNYKVYTDVMKEKMLQKKQLSDQIEFAYKNHEFVAFYQPKYEAMTQKLAGAEALVRWRKPDGQTISPGLFIPLAEESGFVRKLDEYIFREVCTAQKRWLDMGLKVVPVSVNLSQRHLENPEFVDEYKRIVDETGVPIEYIQLEITESAMYEKKKEFTEIVERLHELGFVILMDDFGTGYSTLMMLKYIPVDVMKLDKSFVDDFDDVRGSQIIRCVMRLAQDLQIAITAEGVETKEQYEFLKSIGCDTIQGYYFAKPMPAEEYETCMEMRAAIGEEA
ncbi:MAG: GGDEF domain-containing protein [Roseburia sp.]|nr:GGDEF domain-containing protein [Roseburia sp.]